MLVLINFLNKLIDVPREQKYIFIVINRESHRIRVQNYRQQV